MEGIFGIRHLFVMFPPSKVIKNGNNMSLHIIQKEEKTPLCSSVVEV